jgi:gluconolactonase
VVTRREWLGGALALTVAPMPALAARPAPRTVASALQFPEGLCAMGSGDLLFVEIAAARLRRLSPDGKLSTVAELGGGPNGCAIGPDGAAYIANNGGLTFKRADNGRLAVSGVPADYRSGSIQRVDLASGRVTTLYTQCNDIPLKGPNDLTFDREGGIWFTDTGKIRARDRDQGGLYWCRPDGSEIREVAYPLNAPNGIALSTDGKRLFVALQDKRQILAYDIIGPGRIAGAGKVVAAPAGAFSIDNIALEQDGGIVAAAVGLGGLAVLHPDGSILETILLDDPVVTALAFGGLDHRTLYAALSTTGRIVALDWPRAGLPSPFGAKA